MMASLTPITREVQLAINTPLTETIPGAKGDPVSAFDAQTCSSAGYTIHHSDAFVHLQGMHPLQTSSERATSWPRFRTEISDDGSPSITAQGPPS
ncbi:hypothetical protein FDECE_14626 [Fusarium decemcellulare]|nr:hypothetical protein FDECE_14626 [Fusarium decemcellulare]